MPTPTPAQRKTQADLVRSLTNQWESAANAFDAATVAVEAAQDANNSTFRAYNAVAWITGPDARGITPQQKMDAYAKQIAYETAAAAVPPLMDAARAASLARGETQLKLDAAVAALKENPGAVEQV